MFKIIEKTNLAPQIKKIVVEAGEIARKARPGQFVVIVSKESSERIPLTIADLNPQEGTITLIFQEIGFSTRELGLLGPGDSIQHILGPLGQPTDIENFGTVICVGGGVGIAEIYPVVKAMKKAGNRVLGIIGARKESLIILKEELRELCDEFFITTDDGSLGKKGLVTDILQDLFTSVEKSTHTLYPNRVYAVGPVVMMQAVSNLTKMYNIKTIVSLNPIMVDATGMCGSCRVSVGGKVVFGCVDGPEFDGHQVDFEELKKRLNSFKEKEDSL
ncbi:MAG: sulfide/dihydroorotate dehydrogenase-like FAD/NAD-binding protein [Candidatus Omnitrophota bacterium]|nr:sulfide/dihydroorotate dehydrogenase-like FAD/NAD-binding protein [Candidatus Omnitrophota bacterium]